MPNVRVHKPNGMLFLDFRFKGVRCREYTALPDSPANQKKLEKLLDKITTEIKAGTFEYAAYFPGSRALSRVTQQQNANISQAKAGSTGANEQAVAILQVATVAESPTTPAFATFADQWITDHSIEWRRSHIRSVVSTVQGRIIPHFRDIDPAL